MMLQSVVTTRRHSLNDIQNIISQLEQQRTAIERAIAALRDIDVPAPAQRGRPGRKPGKTAKRTHISDEGRARLAEAMRKRWVAKRSGSVAKKAYKKRAPQKTSSRGAGGRKAAKKEAAA